MPYYVFRMTSQAGMELVKNLELLDEFEHYKQAKSYVRGLRAAENDLQENDAQGSIIKMMFADNQLLAEEQLMEHRDKPVVMEHEK